MNRCASLSGWFLYSEERLWRSGGGVATLVTAASPSAVPPTTAELHASGITFVPSQAPSGMISAAQAVNDLLFTNGGYWTRFPSGTHVARFGYVSSSQIKALSAVAVGADSSLQVESPTNAKSGMAPARVHDVAVWEITFGGLKRATPAPYLPPGSKATTDGSVCSDDTAFVDAKTGHELWEMLNDCTPVPVSTSS